MANFVTEMMAMSTAQSRMVAQDFEWRGQQLRRGELVYLAIAGANRDPSRFSNPEGLDVERPGRQPHLRPRAAHVHRSIGG